MQGTLWQRQWHELSHESIISMTFRCASRLTGINAGVQCSFFDPCRNHSWTTFTSSQAGRVPNDLLVDVEYLHYPLHVVPHPGRQAIGLAILLSHTITALLVRTLNFPHHKTVWLKRDRLIFEFCIRGRIASWCKGRTSFRIQ